MDKKEFVNQLSVYDGLDRGEPIKTVADEDGNIFIFSQNKYGCPVIDVLVEGQDKETLYVSTQKGEAVEYRPTGRLLEETDPREAAINGPYYKEIVPVGIMVDDILALKIMKGAAVVTNNCILRNSDYSESKTQRLRKGDGTLLYPHDISNYAPKESIPLLQKAVTAYNEPEQFAARVEKIKTEREEQKRKQAILDQKNEEMRRLQNEFLQSQRQ